MEVIGYLGPEGSYSYLAARKFRPDAEHKPYPSFRSLMRALMSDECSAVAVPIENSLNGGVNQNIDLLQAVEGIYAGEECSVEIDHRLARLERAHSTGVTRIFSHQQALEQCGEYLAENYPDAELVATPSTAAGLDKLEKSTDACIVGAHTNRAGVVLSADNIADEKNNVTHFLLVKKGAPQEGTHSDKVYFSATCRHESGALIKLLVPICEGGLNMTKIQSRPIKKRSGEYRFFVEIEGDFADANIEKTLKKVAEIASSFKILGVY